MNWELKRHAKLAPVEGPVLLVVMDGVGIGAQDESDAVWLARTPTLDRLSKAAATTALQAHGTAVGLPSDGDMGNSEVGHNALGAGRVFDQGAKRVNIAIESGELFEGEVWKESVARVRESGEPLHFIGLLSDGNVHSHIDHLFAMLRKAHGEGVKKARIHPLMDGRDVPETSALEYVEQVEAVLKELNDGGADYQVASGGGRMKTTMDRYEADWGMVERGWNAHVHGKSDHRFKSLRAAIEGLREAQPGTTDQNLPEFVIVDDAGEPVGPIRDGAAVIFFNFRGDRAVEITRAFTEKSLSAFDRGSVPDVLYAGMMQYDGDLKLPERFLVKPPKIDRTLGEFLARNNVAQWACSETQKYGHVTYFWNGNRSGMFDEKNEKYLEIPSDSTPFEYRPWMKAAEITDATIEAMKSGKYRHLRINYANGDMVGHTGFRDSAVMAVEAVDLGLAQLVPVIEKLKGAIIVTADHGNADAMFEKDKKTKTWAQNPDGSYKPRTSHSLNEVPCHIYAPGRDLKIANVEQPGLSNVAATVFNLLGYEAPEAFRTSLI